MDSVNTTIDNIHLATHLVYTAGNLAYRMRGQGLTIDTKTSISDVVTQADRAAEEYVTSTLIQQRPDDSVLGEEGTLRLGESGTRWTIDPVDGTYNFANNFEYWCSAIAFTENDPTDPVRLRSRERYLSPSNTVTAGAVYQPCTHNLWVGGKNIPTTRNGQPIPHFGDPARETPSSLASACINTYLHPTFYHNPEVYAAFLRVIERCATYRMMGSASVDLASTAEGDTDLWIQHRLPDWDRLPGAALVLGVGGAVQDVEVAGGSVDYCGRAASCEGSDCCATRCRITKGLTCVHSEPSSRLALRNLCRL